MGAAGRQRLVLVQRARGTLSPAASRFAQHLETEIVPAADRDERPAGATT